MLCKHPPERSVVSWLPGFWQLHAKWGQEAANTSNPGGVWPDSGSSPVIQRLHKQNSIGISQLIHSSNVSKQRQSAGLDTCHLHRMARFLVNPLYLGDWRNLCTARFPSWQDNHYITHWTSFFLHSRNDPLRQLPSFYGHYEAQTALAGTPS